MREVLFSKYSMERSPRFAIRTSIMRDGGQKWVEKSPMTQDATDHINKLASSYDALCRAYKGTPVRPCPVAVENGIAKFDFLEGEFFHEKLGRLIEKKDEEGILALCKRYRELVMSAGVEPFQKTPEFVRVFGDVELPEGLTALPFSNVDWIFENLIEEENGDVVLIDYEWCFDFPVPLEYVLYRSFYHTFQRWGMQDFVNRVLCPKTDISPDLISALWQIEVGLARYVERGEHSDIVAWHGYGIVLQRSNDWQGEIERNQQEWERQRQELMQRYEEMLQQQENRCNHYMGELAAARQQHMGELAVVRQQLAQASYNYDVISNAFFWKITKPFRLMSDKLKKYGYHVKKMASLAKKSICILRKDGIAGLIKKYKIYRMKNSDISVSTNVNHRALNSFFRSSLPEPEIPQGWIERQRKTPMISIVIATKCIENRKGYLNRALKSLCEQKYKRFEVVIACPEQEMSAVENVVSPYLETLTIRIAPGKDETKRCDFWDLAMDSVAGEFIGIMEQEDMLTENALAYVLEGCNESPDMQLFVIPDDRFFEDECFFSPDYKDGLEYGIGGWETLLRFGVFRNHGYKFADGEMERWLCGLKKEEITVFPWVGCHGQALPSMWEEPDIRCVAFYLPQFHEIPENNLWWGDGFTEWVNVKGAKPLYQGHQQPRVPGELGYYDLAGETGRNIQKRQIELAQEYGLSGFCYYYYWFNGGKRLLEMPLDRHLQDQTMDFPFCICWANENWTRQWDGQQNEIIMPQTYEDGWAEQFIVDLIPYLKDKRYIRVNGAPYILIYNVDDITNAPDAINTWRRIAAENGIDQLHISAVRRTLEAQELEIAGHTLDSLTDFPPHLLGQVGVDHDQSEKFGLPLGQVKDYRKACVYHIGVEKQRYTYFRTAMLAWDNTARRKDKAHIFEEFSLADYKKWLYAAKRYVLRQNREGENLLFINAWNEWAEGTYLEPSEPMGNAALAATSEVLKMR